MTGLLRLLPLVTFEARGGAGGLVVLAGFKPVAGFREMVWVGSIPTHLRQPLSNSNQIQLKENHA